MADITFEEVLKLTQQVSPEEQQALTQWLQAGQKRVEHHNSLNLLIFDVSRWPEHLTLRREDEYGDDKR